ncbi:branched-chain amino acid ABC transporter permease [Kibdelosporangium persicum]|uniref:Branched-chain amino acid transport system permease protein LivM n=1 Tax=Kibdelosporangium persicum TaxID=2698649 RepID=A0ABX2FD04_9PSEU|nr:branched-chain amino acid ABC transporter permease [Kibdelosporangium persicum]NRN69244.1 Branched-chain amino acid transport system permease protein LivM [Kibdelosporangium persicum]
MTKTFLSPPIARILGIAGAVLAIVAAMLPWTTFVLNKGAWPDKATLQFFDAPFALTGFRWELFLVGIVALVCSVVKVPAQRRVLRGLGFGVAAIGLVNFLFITAEGGGLGAVTAADGASAFGSVAALVAGGLLILGTFGQPLEEIPRWKTNLPTPVEYLGLLVSFAVLLYVVSLTLTAGGQGGAANPYSGPMFLSFLGFGGGLMAAAAGLGILRWISKLSEKHRAFSIIVLLLCAFLLPFTNAGTEYWMTVAANIGVYAATAIGLNIVVGLAGLLDLGYVAFLGIGAFVAANLSGAAASSLGIHLPFYLVVIISAAIAGIFGAVVGSPTLRVRGDYLAIVTLAFGEIFQIAARNNIGGLTGGSNSIPNIPPLQWFDGTAYNESITLFGTPLPSGVLYYFLIVVLIAAVMAVFANLKNSRMGRAWIAIREDEDAARAMGIKTGKAKILAFLCGAVLAGIAGAVFAHKTSTVGYESFLFMESVTLLAAVILGGMGSIPGAVLGASLLFVLPEKLRAFSDYRLLIFGLALILIMRFRPQGLIPDRHRRAELAGEDAEGHTLAETPGDEPEQPRPQEVPAR